MDTQQQILEAVLKTNTQIGEMRGELASVRGHTKDLKKGYRELDNRVRILERWKARTIGAIAVVGAIATAILAAFFAWVSRAVSNGS